jgi:hypothetical protein
MSGGTTAKIRSSFLESDDVRLAHLLCLRKSTSRKGISQNQCRFHPLSQSCFFEFINTRGGDV